VQFIDVYLFSAHNFLNNTTRQTDTQTNNQQQTEMEIYLHSCFMAADLFTSPVVCTSLLQSHDDYFIIITQHYYLQYNYAKSM